MRRIAIVVQRCHPSVIGGSEILAWQYASLLKDEYEVDVLTTTAVDAATWKNVLPPGREERGEITIHRFKVDEGRTPYWHALHERLLDDFNHCRQNEISVNVRQKRIFWTRALEEEFILKQGPHSENLLNFLSSHFQDFKTVIFLTYLFPTTYFGVEHVPKEKSLLVPTLHNEPPAYLSSYRSLVRKVRFILWNTESEKRLGSLLWGELPGRIVGMGINTKQFSPSSLRYPYLLYCGRIDPFKGIAQLLEYFLKYKKDHPSELRLVLTGKDEIGLPKNADIEFKGFVSEEEKFQLMAGAFAFMMPSPYESLSIVTLEAMAQGTPVLVNGLSEVLVEHIQKSGGGSIYVDYEEFSTFLNDLLKNSSMGRSMGEKARDYVVAHYSVESVKNSLVEIIESRDDLKELERT